MSEKREEADGQWLDRLDEIVDGVDESSPGNDELLQLARHMRVVLAPLRELDTPARAHRQRLKGQLRAQLATQRSWPRRVFRPLMVAAALLLFILLGPGLIFELNQAGGNSHLSKHVKGWRMPDLSSVESFDMLSPTHLPSDLVLMVPTNVLPDAYLLAINAKTHEANSTIQSYLIYEQNALIYESPSSPPPALAYTDPIYQIAYVGNTAVFITQTSDGNNRLEWYQNGLLCDFVSDQPVAQLLAMVQQLRLVVY